MKATVRILAALLLLTPSAFAQSSPSEKNPVSEAVRNIVARESKIITAAAEEMPADKYGYHPTPAQMTFGHLVMHMAGSNNFLCSKISGMPAPDADKLADTDPKDKLVQALKSSFDFCTEALAKIDDSVLGEPVTLFGGRNTTKAAAMVGLTDDFYDHYSAAAMYLRLNDLLPPTAQKK
ncbi:MAG TPA: DinB family protein [Candidatus Cybelea sp.]|nr:DinB family protein [Candidatus Cybelea sp.]